MSVGKTKIGSEKHKIKLPSKKLIFLLSTNINNINLLSNGKFLIIARIGERK